MWIHLHRIIKHYSQIFIITNDWNIQDEILWRFLNNLQVLANRVFFGSTFDFKKPTLFFTKLHHSCDTILHNSNNLFCLFNTLDN